jgi:hypothetical protein
MCCGESGVVGRYDVRHNVLLWHIFYAKVCQSGHYMSQNGIWQVFCIWKNQTKKLKKSYTMNINSLTIKAQEALQAAVALAGQQGQQAVEPLHLLSVIIKEDDSLGAFLLGRVGVNIRTLRDEVERAVASIAKVSGGNGEQYFSNDTSKVIQRAVDFTRTFNDKYASV